MIKLHILKLLAILLNMTLMYRECAVHDNTRSAKRSSLNTEPKLRPWWIYNLRTFKEPAKFSLGEVWCGGNKFGVTTLSKVYHKPIQGYPGKTWKVGRICPPPGRNRANLLSIIQGNSYITRYSINNQHNIRESEWSQSKSESLNLVVLSILKNVYCLPQPQNMYIEQRPGPKA